MNQEVKISQLNPTTFEFQDYTESDERLISTFELDTSFTSSTDYIEYYVYDENQNQIFPQEPSSLTSFNVKAGDVLLNPSKDLESFGFDIGIYNILYNFYRELIGSSINENYFIKEISSDRTEIRLDSNIINKDVTISTVNSFIENREKSSYFVDFYLNFGKNKIIIANNIRLDIEADNTVLIKLYEPLPDEFDLKSELWLVDIISEPQLYKVEFIEEPIIIQDSEPISGPNFNIGIKNERGGSDQEFCLNELVDTSITSSYNQLRGILDQKGININVDYEGFDNFVHFSSAKTRLENFYYKIKVIEDLNTSLSSTLDTITGDTINTLSYSSSKATITSQIDELVQNFDGYEKFLYYNSGSDYSWPKSNNSIPYILATTGSAQVLSWIDNITLSSSLYDEDNNNWLYHAIPGYLKEDPDNRQYELFVDMVGQHFDNIWIYTKDITNKFNADNRLEYGISRDLVAEAIKDFGVKLYSNKYNVDDLYNAFLGYTSEFNLFPINSISTTIPANTGSEYVDTKISASSDIIPLDEVNKRLYKRIYHNIPYLFKTKGTKASLRALITSYGIPNTILRIDEFGGKDRNNNQDWDLEQNKFNYAYGVNNTNNETGSYINIPLTINDNFILTSGSDRPSTLQFRFKTKGIPSSSIGYRYSQSLLITDTLQFSSVIQYSSSSLSTYSGSSPTNNNEYGEILFGDGFTTTSFNLPIFDGGWWSVMCYFDEDSDTQEFFIGNKIGNEVGFYESASIIGSATINSSSYLNFPSPIKIGPYFPFSGSYQEIRYYNNFVNESKFKDYILNPYSIEEEDLHENLIFRAALGSDLNTVPSSSDSFNSIHPKITGSNSFITSSFTSSLNSAYEVYSGSFVTNEEKIYQDQTIAGIKNRVTDKIHLKSSTAPSENQLTPYRSLEQKVVSSGSYSPDINYLEVAFSPQNEINDDINSQLGYFNIGEYIGDPRQISSSNRSYVDLDNLRDTYFNKYIKSYNIRDFIRLIKFFDNSLFKMIEDFTPARTSLSSGIVIKQHILERNRQRPAQASYQDQKYTGSVKPQSRNYNTGSGDTGQYEYNDGSSIYRFKGGTGGSFEVFNGLQTSPSASAYGLTNKFNITQSWAETVKGPLGIRTVEVWDQEEFYDGEFSGSCLLVTDQDLNPDCNPYSQVVDTPVRYRPLFFNTELGGFTDGTVSSVDWLDPNNSPANGDAWFLTNYNFTTNEYEVTYIKLSTIDINGNVLSDFINHDLDFVEFLFPEGNKEYYINGFQVNATNILLTIDQSQGDYSTGSLTENKGSENWSLYADGDFKASQGVNTNNTSQGTLIDPTLTQLQYFQYWNGTITDALTFMGSGSSDFTSSNLFTEDNFPKGTYNALRTSNIPWIFSCSIAYSSSDNMASGSIDTLGLYHSGSSTTSTGAFSSGTTILYNPGTFETMLDSNFFATDEWTSSLEGNVWDYSSTTQSGHPMIIATGSASFDFHFDTITLGEVTSGGSDKAFYYPFSGSTWFNDNVDFTGTETTDPDTDGLMDKMDEDDRWHFDADTFFAKPITSFQCEFALDAQLVTGNWFTDGARLALKYSRTTSSLAGGWAEVDGVDNSSAPIADNGGVAFTKILNQSWFTSKLSGDSRPFYFRMEIKVKNDFTYRIDDWTLTYSYVDDGTPVPTSGVETAFAHTQGSGLSEEFFVSDGVSGTTEGTADVRAILKYTSSAGDVEITSSNTLLSQSITSSNTLNFSDSPILGTIPHVNTTESMYYVQYEFTNITSSVNVNFETDDVYPKLYITQSVEIDSSAGYYITGSLRIYQGNVDDSVLDVGTLIIDKEFNVTDSSSIDRFSFSESWQNGFDYNDAFRMAIYANKSYNGGLTINEYTMSVYPDNSVLSPILEPYQYGNYKSPTSSAVIVPTFFGDGILPFSFALDCQPLLNNYVNNRESSWLMDVDYTTNIYQPVNSASIYALTATPATIADSNYTVAGFVNPRYKGSKSTSEKINIWTPKDIGTYGKLPTIELRTAFFGYFDSIRDAYPNVNDTVNLNLTYLVDEQGNAIPPSLQGIGLTNLIQSFPEGGLASISINSGSKELKELNNLYPTNIVGKYATPIMYSQTSSIGHSTSIPLTGSGRISLYDNNDAASFHDYSFIAQGSSSLGSLPSTNFNQDLNPSENIEVKSYATSSPYSGSTGILHFPDEAALGLNGNNLSDNQHIFLETSFTTNFLYESGKAEMNVKLSLISGSTNVPFELEDVFLTVHKSNGTKFNIGSVITDSNDIIRFATSTIRRLTQGIGMNSNSQIEMVFENYAIKELLKQRGLYKSGDGGVELRGDIVALEWGIKANSGDYIFKKNDNIKWNLKGNLIPSGGSIQSVFYPTLYTGKVLPTKISTFGSKTHLLSGDNSGSAPYWVFTGSSGGGSDILDQKILVMSSSNINEAYGGSHYQGELPYTVGPSEYHPGGTEPTGTRFDTIVSPIEFYEGDEIRFGNNEKYSYKIKRVTPPQQNIESDGKGRIKIELDKAVPTSVNKDFFLVRRFIDNANSVLLGVTYPYSDANKITTTSGILFPEFPVLSLQASASAIITDLVGKGVIK